MLPPVAAAAITHAFVEYYGGEGRGGGGAWGGSADFVALTALYVFAFHMAMGVRLLWLALLRFNVGWSGSGGPLRLGPGNNGDGKWRRK